MKILLTVLILVIFLAGCGDTSTKKSSSDITTSKLITVGDSKQQMVELLGETKEIQSNRLTPFGTFDLYRYGDTIYYIQEQVVGVIKTSDPSFSTKKDIAVGDSADKIYRLYEQVNDIEIITFDEKMDEVAIALFDNQLDKSLMFYVNSKGNIEEIYIANQAIGIIAETLLGAISQDLGLDYHKLNESNRSFLLGETLIQSVIQHKVSHFQYITRYEIAAHYLMEALEIALRNGNDDMADVLRQIGEKEYGESVENDSNRFIEPPNNNENQKMNNKETLESNQTDEVVEDEFSFIIDEETGERVLVVEESEYSRTLKRNEEIVRKASELSLGVHLEEVINTLGEPDEPVWQANSTNNRLYYDSSVEYHPIRFIFKQEKLIGLRYSYSLLQEYILTETGVRPNSDLKDVIDVYKNNEVKGYQRKTNPNSKLLIVDIAEDEVKAFEFLKSPYDGSFPLVSFSRGTKIFIANVENLDIRDFEEIDLNY
ncbi:hypothetical protein J2S74_000197 [Evansella vedderi]|uniref:Uncharacterized protein n=1 Tax=Evansella vedderi TaxID=38282 RepID=A0ABT9ZNL0_9BACI|nr:hypothetical protein [Evansella vedderi]MDQ0252825.1 hypothetical protein [Evansella vedderi]